jgi:hypothetical protein
MAVARDASLRTDAELLADVYGLVLQRSVRPAKWLIPVQEGGSYVGKVTEEARVALVSGSDHG